MPHLTQTAKGSDQNSQRNDEVRRRVVDESERKRGRADPNRGRKSRRMFQLREEGFGLVSQQREHTQTHLGEGGREEPKGPRRYRLNTCYWVCKCSCLWFVSQVDGLRGVSNK